MHFQNAVKKRNYRLIAKKTKKEAQKLTVAGFILIALIVMSYGLAEKYNLFNWLESETVYIKINEAKAEEVKVEIDQEKQRLEDLADYIWLKESTKGKNNYSKCEAIGKVNGIGYGIYNGKYLCFENHAKEMEVLENWLKEHKNLSDNEKLCLYNTGKVLADCDYIKLWKV